MNNTLGAIPVSSDIPGKAGIGLWAIEYIEGYPPRMFADDAMLKQIGLERQMSPEGTYTIWFESIDTESRSLVAHCIEKMKSGECTDVQYPWHCPDGNVIMIRFSGTLNSSFTKGIRTEGIFQNSSDIPHFQAEEIERKYLNIVGALAGDYDCIMYVNVNEDKNEDSPTTYKDGKELTRYMPEWYGEHLFIKRLRMIESCLVHPEDAERSCDYGLAFYTRVS